MMKIWSHKPGFVNMLAVLSSQLWYWTMMEENGNQEFKMRQIKCFVSVKSKPGNATIFRTQNTEYRILNTEHRI